MLTGLIFYADASGKAETDAISVCGFVASVAQWDKFRKDWAALLKRYDLPAPFHMTDFMSPDGRYGGFDGRRKRQFFSNALGIIQRRTKRLFSHSILMNDYRAVNKKYRLDDYVEHPYALAGAMAALKANIWVRKTYGQTMPLRIVFDRGDHGWHYLVRQMSALNLPEPAKASVDECPELSCADIVVWVKRKQCSEIARDALKVRSWYFEQVRAAFSDENKAWTVAVRESLESVCESFGVERRD